MATSESSPNVDSTLSLRKPTNDVADPYITRQQRYRMAHPLFSMSLVGLQELRKDALLIERQRRKLLIGNTGSPRIIFDQLI